MRPRDRVGRAARRTLAAVKRLTWLERKPLSCVPHRDLRWFAIPKQPPGMGPTAPQAVKSIRDAAEAA